MEEKMHHMMPIIQRLEDVGRVKEKLTELVMDDIFDNLSKHNPYFDSEHAVESEKLYDLRMKLSYINDQLSDVLHILELNN